MVTIKSLLRDELFDDFEFVAGRNGVGNRVEGTGIFDWETPEEIKRTFNKGDFVITTLGKAKDDEKTTEECLKTLLEIRVSAIAVRSIYYSEVKESIMDLADTLEVPIFIFKKATTEGIIYFIEKKIAEATDRQVASDIARKLLADEQDENTLNHFIKKIGIQLYENTVCLYCKNTQDVAQDVDNDIDKDIEEVIIKNLEASKSNSADYSTIKVGNGILLIYSFAVQSTAAGRYPLVLKNLIKKLERSESISIGISRTHKTHDEIGEAMKESIFSNISGTIENKKTREFDSMGVDKFLIPVQNNKWVAREYNTKIDLIKEYDKENEANLLKTLIAFVECNGSMKLTGDKMYQHENTIRYRIDRIKKILEMENSEDYFIEMYIIVRLYKVKEFIDI